MRRRMKRGEETVELDEWEKARGRGRKNVKGGWDRGMKGGKRGRAVKREVEGEDKA